MLKNQEWSKEGNGKRTGIETGTGMDKGMGINK